METQILTEEVAQEVVKVTTRFNPRTVGFVLGGLSAGIAIGFYLGHRYKREKIKAEAFKKSEEEVEKIREVYQQKVTAHRPKPPVEEVVERRGYGAPREEGERPLRPPVPVDEPLPQVVYAPPRVDVGGRWSYDEEVKQRNPDEPYVIHQDEYKNEETDYHQVTYTYYHNDDVLVDEDNRPLPHAQEIIGLDNLKFGHGTDDVDVVFVRNDRLQIEMEICRIYRSYEVEVLGHQPDDDDDEDETD